MKQHYRKPFQGSLDPAKVIWSNKTHRSASEAFRDADYATPIWRCSTETEDAMRFLKEFTITSVLLAGAGFTIYSLIRWVGLM